jgi:hypothetical protein
VSPVTVNSVGLVPPIVTEDTVTLEPLAVRVPVAVPFRPTTTLPTAIGVVTLNVPGATPVPVRFDTDGELLALLAKEAVAVAAPLAVGENFTVKFTGVAVVTVTGNVRPVTVNSDALVPPMVTDATVTLPPVAVKVPVAVPLAPSPTLPTAIGDVTAKVVLVEATAVPLNGMERLGLDASDVMVTLPLKLPVDCGEKVTLSDVLWPGVRVTGGVMPDMVKPVPLIVAAEIVVFTPPVFFNDTVWLGVWPTVTLVKVRLVGVGVTVAGATAVPLRGRDSDEFVAFDVTVTLPLIVPVDCGAKVTVNEVVCPGVRVPGVNPEMLKPAPLATTCETATLVAPVFCSVSV